jgi:hypothetical protein
MMGDAIEGEDSMAQNVRIESRPDGRIRFTFPYDADLIDSLKRHIPKYARAYRPDARAWDIRRPYDAVLRDLIEARLNVILPPDQEEFRRTIEVELLRSEVERLRTMIAERANIPEHYRAVHLLPSAPPELVQAARRALVKLHHPDAGGDVRTMQDVNAAFDIIQGGQ